MKLFSCMMIACALEAAAAFAPPTFGVSKAALTQANMVDPSIVHHLGDAVNAVIADCHDGECSLVDGWRDGEGWHFEERLGEKKWEAPSPEDSTRVLMKMLDDTE